MKLADVVNGPWAIVPDMLLEIQGIYATHLRGDKINIPQVEASIGRPLNNSRQGSTITDGIAVIPIQGVMAKKMNMFMDISGGVSTQYAAADLRTALGDPAVHSIILNIDSPGGTVDGTQELADVIYGARGQKQIVAYSDGQVCSAAYWAASAATEIYISGDTNAVGSIGVVFTHRDISGAEAKAGIKTTEVTAGKYKRVSSQYEPLNAAGLADMQDKADYLYSVFVDAFARNRGVSSDTVVKQMADGRIFMGKQAVDAGLVDGVATLDALITMLCDPAKKKTTSRAGGAQAHIESEETMDIATLKEKHPDLVTAISAEATQGMVTSEAATKLATDATAAEQARVIGLVSAAMGTETGEKLTALATTGISAEQATALNIRIETPGAATDEAKADEASRAAILSALKSASPDGLKQTKADGDNKESEEARSNILAGAGLN